ncbi:hypothetical protein SPRG_16070 [Saprolegnia parasitica CBS 223.65]|uniref:RING-type domain-containing protein n=1 Tax=Saprolegnia parasitica (strain CBS 223.65) TaxID=695850 RepID=A0A067BJJ1_SAPPC|nr:hypothetical protein SPRG_16070 [Saprolegnia parasitica CBS 223.65]KDO18604.1 hypothetical protein SPRG_16070 [Saprolegnia parasitica CBS 223.65]|eukprot:XP_012210685.1 hypothetical protein SPRG_16070 [Saprolegnia parasitica CBS 223.65]
MTVHLPARSLGGMAKSASSTEEHKFLQREAKAVADHQRLLHRTRATPDATRDAAVAELESQLHVFKDIQATFSMATKDDKYRRKRELYRFQQRLPAYAKRDAIERAVTQSRFVVVQGQTGSGKSTQIPQYLAELFPGTKILVTQPRKLAAMALAERVALEFAGGYEKAATVGGDVGYRVGGRRQCRTRGRIEFITEGVLLDMIMRQDDELFKGIGAIVVDEAHERSIMCDLLLGSLKSDDARWRSIPLVVTSATIDVDLFSTYFGGAPIVDIPGRMFPVDVLYTPTPDGTKDMATYMAQMARLLHRDSPQGDILCFLPGQDDVLRAHDVFEKHPEPGLVARTLYGKQDPADQKLAFAHTPEQRKVLFATDVAETSITIPGVVYVVDSGLKKGVSYDHVRKIASLKVQSIARSSAIQRAGRAGRTQAGTCVRLYSEHDFELMETSTLPEIFRQPLALAVLTLRRLGIDPKCFEWLSAPPADAMAAAERELTFLGALESGRVTALGTTITTLQQPPELVRMLVKSCAQGHGEAALQVAAVQSVAHMFAWRDKTKKPSTHPMLVSTDGDIVPMVRALAQYRNVLKGVTQVNDTPVRDVVEPSDETPVVALTAGHLRRLNGQPRAAIHEHDDDDNDGNTDETRSECSSEASSGDSSESVPTPPKSATKSNFRTKKIAAQKWCQQNRLNNKALGLAVAFQDELRGQVADLDVWRAQPQTATVSDSDLRRIVFYGYFLHVACLKRDRSHMLQYCAVEADVVGTIPIEAAIQSGVPPDWIVYDKIFRPAGRALLVTCTPVDEEWLASESPDFARIVSAKLPALPISTVVLTVPGPVLKKLVGKQLCNLEALEVQLGCTLHVVPDKGQLLAFCTPAIARGLQPQVDALVAPFQEEMLALTTEQTYLGGTRAVLGAGFVVNELLFDDEYVTVYVRQLPATMPRRDVRAFVAKAAANCAQPILRALEQQVVNGGDQSTVAKQVLTRLQGEVIAGRNVQVSAGKAMAKPGLQQSTSSRIKVSWATAASKGVVKVWFKSASDANRFLLEYRTILPEASRAVAIGASETPAKTPPNGLKPLPPVTRMANKVYLFNLSTDFTSFLVAVHGLPPAMDEVVLTERLTSMPHERFRIDRVVNSSADQVSSAESVLAVRARRLGSVLARMPFAFVATDFLDAGRAGVYIVSDDTAALEALYTSALQAWAPAEMPCGQPIRLALEHTYVARMHVEVFKKRTNLLAPVLTDARRRGVTVFEVPTKTIFQAIRFTCTSRLTLGRIQAELGEITKCTQFKHADIKRLFSGAGRRFLGELSNDVYVHWNARTGQIFVYGFEDEFQKAKRAMIGFLEQFAALEVIDHVLMLDKRKIKSLKFASVCARAFDHYVLGAKLYLSGSRDAILAITTSLQGVLFPKRSGPRTVSTSALECPLCLCDVDATTTQLTLCGHTFCTDCILPMFGSQDTKLPLRCPRDGCEAALSVEDCVKLVPPSQLEGLAEKAVELYRVQHEDAFSLCPQPGCNQVFRIAEYKKGKQGEYLAVCDNCEKTYCITCSDKLATPADEHPPVTCQLYQLSANQTVTGHARRICNEILTLACPKCKAAFLDFSGCTCVTCGNTNCSTNFCANCLVYHDMDSGTCHNHVRSCPSNPNQGNYFVSAEQLQATHASARKKQTAAYLTRATVAGDERRGVWQMIERDLADLGVHFTAQELAQLSIS